MVYICVKRVVLWHRQKKRLCGKSIHAQHRISGPDSMPQNHKPFQVRFWPSTIKESQTQGETLKVTGNCKLEKAINTLKAHAIY